MRRQRGLTGRFGSRDGEIEPGLADGASGELGPRLDTRSLEDPTEMRLDRLARPAECVTDFVGREPIGDQPDDVGLARRQYRRRRVEPTLEDELAGGGRPNPG